jgi:hypothetical protein
MDSEATTKTPTPAPVADHQNERTTYADVATEEDCDVVQTSALDVANAEIARLAAEVARLTHERGALLSLRAAIEKHGIHAHPDDVDAALARLRALERQTVAPAVRLEWGKWDGDLPNCVKLWAFTAGIAHTVAQITDDHEFVSLLWLTHPCGDQTIQIAGDDLTKVSAILAANLAMMGLTMPPVPALPEKAA